MGSNIKIRKVDFQEWIDLWSLCTNSNILQSWFYGHAKSESDGFEFETLCVSDSDQDVALVQVLQKKILFLGPLTRINRGPIFLKNDISMELKCKVIEAIILKLKKDSLLIQIAPEINQTIEAEIVLRQLGLNKLSNIPWSSGNIDLTYSEEDLLMSLNGKWRNCYRKGKKMGVLISNVSDSPEELKSLIENYEKLQTKKDFSGLTGDLILSLARNNHKLWSFNILKAIDKDENLLGYLVTIDHGDTSIYLIGLTTEEGRRFQANYVMLWEAILNAKKTGCMQFDIGGLTDETPKGVAHFKNGLKPEMYSLIGEWRGLYLKNIIRF